MLGKKVKADRKEKKKEKQKVDIEKEVHLEVKEAYRWAHGGTDG